MDVRSIQDYIKMRNRYSDIKEDELIVGATIAQQKAIDEIKAQYGGSYVKKINNIKDDYYTSLYGGSWKEWFQKTFGKPEDIKQNNTQTPSSKPIITETKQVITQVSTKNNNINTKTLIDTIINGLDKQTYTVDEVKTLLRIVYNS